MQGRIMTAVVLCSIFCLQEAWADGFSKYPAGALKGDGILLSRSDAAGSKDDRDACLRGADFTPGKIKLDLAGISLGPEAVVKVKSHAPRTPGAGAGSYDVYVPVPMGFVFDQTNIMDVTILDVKKDGGRAALIVHVETVSSYAGKLRLQYEHVVDEWVLRRIENLSFKAG